MLVISRARDRSLYVLLTRALGQVVIPFTSVWASSECEMEGWFDVAKVQPKDSATGKLFVRVKYEGPIPQAVAVASSAAREASPAAAITTEPVEATPPAGNEELEVRERGGNA